jgi:hypothetical protein
MRARVIVIAAMMTVGSAALADPPKDPQASASSPQKPAAEVVLASADTARAPVPETARPNTAPAKRRVARVTTCRCGDPQVDPDTQEQ